MRHQSDDAIVVARDDLGAHVLADLHHLHQVGEVLRQPLDERLVVLLRIHEHVDQASAGAPEEPLVYDLLQHVLVQLVTVVDDVDA